jgi:hypothetical protein
MNLEREIEAIIDDNCVEIPYEGTDVDKGQMRYDIKELAIKFAKHYYIKQLKAINEKGTTQQLIIDWVLKTFHLHLIIIPTVTGRYTFKWIDVQLDPENVIERPPYKNVDSSDYNTITQAKEAAINKFLTELI